MADGEPVPLRTVARGWASGVREEALLVVESEDAWRELWARHATPLMPPPRPPPVDFGAERALAVFMGERPTGGHAASVERARREGERLVVDVRFEGPPADALVTMVLTQPYHVVAAPAGPEPVDFRVERRA